MRSKLFLCNIILFVSESSHIQKVVANLRVVRTRVHRYKMQNANEYQKRGRHAMIASQNDFRDEHETFILYTEYTENFYYFPESLDRQGSRRSHTQLYCEKVLGDVTIRDLFESRYFAENPCNFARNNGYMCRSELHIVRTNDQFLNH